MDWSRRVDTRSGDKAHGITFQMWERDGKNVRGEAAYGTRKLHLDGKASITLAFDQWKYGDELIVQLFTKERGLVADRRADGYNRVQVYLGPANEETAAVLDEIASAIRARKNPNNP